MAQQRYPYRADTVVNYDECRITTGLDGAIVLEAIARKRSNLVGTKEETLATLISFILASGEVILSAYILKGSSSKTGESKNPKKT